MALPALTAPLSLDASIAAIQSLALVVKQMDTLWTQASVYHAAISTTIVASVVTISRVLPARRAFIF